MAPLLLPLPAVGGAVAHAPGQGGVMMKVIHVALSGLLTEVKERGKVDGIRLAALVQSTADGDTTPRYASWVIVSAHMDWEKWSEWRLLVGRQRAVPSAPGAPGVRVGTLRHGAGPRTG